MPSTFVSLLTIILFTLLVNGYGQCELKDITVGTERTNREVGGKEEWKVSFINTCKCPQKSLIVSCDGFQSTETVDPNLFASVGNNNCIVNGGQPIGPFATVGFVYAWDPPFIFVPRSSQVQCG
ncbi:TPD1 protein homolog 1 [Lactuca sativa]|uniref:Uncharacterized protein n=1 Tax=Lactuca sativa TaxID=4236 RepID=A0A9R1V9E2_LACSA|nr:TPD1 protein homolog 1 [Lactuca sativa]KAJ0200610.1 hypothetical protein LSAT_V11C600340910 [Lactuca sativa]